MGRGFPVPVQPTPSRLAFDAAGAGAYGSASLSWNHTINGSAALTYIVIDTLAGFDFSPSPTCSVGSTAMTQLATVNYYDLFFSSNYFRVDFYVFGLLNPPQGLQTISAASPNRTVNAGLFAGNSVSYRNVKSFGSTQSTTGSIASTGIISHNASASGKPMISQCFASQLSSFSGYSCNQRSLLNYSATSNFSILIGDGPTPNSRFSTTYTYRSGENGWGSLLVPMYG